MNNQVLKIGTIILLLSTLFYFYKNLTPKKLSNQHHLECCKSSICRFYTSPGSIKKDSISVQEIIEEAKKRKSSLNKNLVQKRVFAKSTVELVEVKENFKDYLIQKYNSCTANMDNDTVEITMLHENFYDNVGLCFPNNRRHIKLRCWPGGFDTELNYAHVYFDHLIINQNSFEKGDTICGRINIRGNYGKVRTQMIKGSFKTIIF